MPSGTFMMGSPEDEPERNNNEGPQHEVTIPKPFAIGRCAVTRGQFAAFVAGTGHKTDWRGGYITGGGGVWKSDPSKSWRDPGFAQDDSHPVVRVNWDDAQAYVTWLSQASGAPYRLPSEAEWEWVCRAGGGTPFWWGSGITQGQANYGGTYSYGRDRTVPARHFEPNPWGLYQVHGNVWEWCGDCWNNSYQGAPADGSAWATGNCSRRVLRGGSWDDNYPKILRAVCRKGNGTDARYYDYGFRVARTLTP
ncbi:MAG: formylglycine-generating enzyme family protein [Rhodomicrobium sp.]